MVSYWKAIMIQAVMIVSGRAVAKYFPRVPNVPGLISETFMPKTASRMK